MFVSPVHEGKGHTVALGVRFSSSSDGGLGDQSGFAAGGFLKVLQHKTPYHNGWVILVYPSIGMENRQGKTTIFC